MNQRQALKGGLITAIAGIVPLPVLQKAIQLHDVRIDIDENKNAMMKIDGDEPIPLKSMVLSVRYGLHPFTAWYDDEIKKGETWLLMDNKGE